MSKNQISTGRRLAAMLLSILMAVTGVPIPTLASGVDTSADPSRAILKEGTAVNAALKTLAGDVVQDASQPGSVSDAKITRIVRSADAPDGTVQTVNIAASGSPDILAWFDPSAALPHTGMEDAAAAEGGDAAADQQTAEAAPAEETAPAADAAPAETTAPADETQTVSEPQTVTSAPAAQEEETPIVQPSEEENEESVQSTPATSETQAASSAAVSSETAAASSETASSTASQDPNAKGVIRLYTTGTSMAYGKDAKSMFEGMTVLSDIKGLQGIDFTSVEDASRMFYGDAALKDFTPIASYDGSSVKKAEYTFQGSGMAADAVPDWYVKANTVDSSETTSSMAEAVSEAADAESSTSSAESVLPEDTDSTSSQTESTVSSVPADAESTAESAAESIVSSEAESASESMAESTESLTDEEKAVLDEIFNFYANYNDGGETYAINATATDEEPTDTSEDSAETHEIVVTPDDEEASGDASSSDAESVLPEEETVSGVEVTAEDDLSSESVSESSSVSSEGTALPKTGRKGMLPKTNITSVTLFDKGDSQSYGTWSTSPYKVKDQNGTVYTAICMTPKLHSPKRTNTYSGANLTEISNPLARKILYYGYAGPADKGYSLPVTHVALAKAMGDGHWSYRAGSDTISQANQMIEAMKGLPSVPSGVKAYKITTYGDNRQNLCFIEHAHVAHAYITKQSTDTKLSNTDHYSLAGAIFEVYNSENKRVAILKTNKYGNTDKQKLYAGTYTVKEVQAPKGFRLNTKPQTITVKNDGSTYHVIFQDTPYKHGHLKIHKVTSAWGNDLSGASFALYEWSKKQNKYVGTGYKLNKKSGSLWESDELYETEDNLGRFMVRETAAPAHAVKVNGDMTYDLTKTKGHTNTYTFKNDILTRIRIKKADPYDPNAKLAGAEFSVQQYNRDTGKYEKYLTMGAAQYDAKTGYYSIEVRNTEKNGGKFRVIETKAPAGYTASFTRDITVHANSSYDIDLTTAYNQPNYPHGRIEIKKTDAKTGLSITDDEASTAEFAVYEWQAQLSQYREIGTMTWDNQKKIFWIEGLPIRIKANHKGATASSTINWNEGKYRVIERKAPKGYANSKWTKDFTFVSNDTSKTEVLTASVSNTPNGYQIRKVSEQDPKKMVNATFRLTTSGDTKTVTVVNGTDEKEEPVDSTKGVTLHTVNGVINLTKIQSGSYTYVETAVDKPYVMITPVRGSFTINENGLVSDDDEKQKGSASVTVKNTPEVDLTIVKKSSDAGVIGNNFPAGTEFRIEEWSTTTNAYKYYTTAIYGTAPTGHTNTFIDKTTKDTIRLAWSTTNQGKFRVTETQATPGYILDKTAQTVTLPANITADTKPITVTFTNKPNEVKIHKVDTTGKELENCTFEVWNTDNKSLYDKTAVSKIKNAKGTGDDTKALATFSVLVPGSYAYREVGAPNGYTVDTKVYPFKVNSDGTITGSDGKAADIFTVTVENQPTEQFRITKTDDKGNTYAENGFPAGTVFAVYEWSEATKSYSTVPVKYVTFVTDEDKAAGKAPVISSETKARAGGSLPKTGRSGKLPKTGVKDGAKYNFTYGWNDGTYMYLNVRNKSTGAVVKNVSIYVGAHIDANHKFSTGAWTHDGITWYYRIANSKISVREKVSGVNLYADTVHTDASTRVPNRWTANSGFGCFASYKVYFEDESGKRIKTVTKNLGDYIVTGAPSLTKTGYALTWKKLSTDGTYSAVKETPPGTTPEERSSRGTSTNYLAAYDEGTNKASEEQRNPYLHVKAFWTANTYHVHFNANGGTGSMGDQTMTYDKAANLTANAFTRNGYTFNGWNTQANGKGTSYANKASVRNLTSTANGTVTLYAQWTANQYKVHFDANTGSGSMGDQSMTYGTAANLTANAFTRNGYTFNGWNTQKDGKGASYANKASVKNLTAAANTTINLYAQWKPIQFTMHYDANGGTGTMADQKITYDVATKLTKNAFTRTGYTFVNWKDYFGHYFSDEQSILNIDDTENVYTIWAQWTPNTYKIRFASNGGTGTMADESMTYDTAKALTANTFQRAGWTFTGWNTQADGKGDRSFTNGETVNNLTATDGGTVLLYAQWKQGVYKISYNLAGGTAGSGAPSTYTAGSATTIPQPTRNGYIFLGWTSSELGLSDPQQSAFIPTTQAGDVTLTAHWAKAGSFVDPTTMKDPAMTVTKDNKGKFRVKEVQAAEGYILDEQFKDIDLSNHTYKVNGTGSDVKMQKTTGANPIDLVPFTNKPNSYTIRKVNLSGQPLAGVTFTVTNPKGEKHDYKTGADGTITLKALATGTWSFKETATLQGYVLDPKTYTFTISSPDHHVNGKVSDHGEATAYNTDRKPKSFIIKKEDENGNPIPGVAFYVTNTKGKTNYVYTRTDSDNYGTYEVVPGTDEKNGTYLVQEAPLDKQDRYHGILKIDTTVYKVTLTDGSFSPDDVIITVKNSTNHVILRKVNANNQTIKIAGAQYRVWNDNTDANTKYDKILVTDGNGEIRIDNLAAGTWHYQEKVAPSGYKLNGTAGSFTVASDGTIGKAWTHTENVIEYPNTFTLKKVGADGKPLAGASFRIWNDRTETGAYDKTLTTDANGNISVQGLMPGLYHYQETAAPAGYLVDRTIKDVTLADGQDATVTAKDVKNHLVIRKVDKDGKVVLGAQFGITFDPATAGQTSVVMNNSTAKTSDGKTMYLWNAGSDGTVSFTGLAAGTYTYRETKAPDKYKLNPSVYTLTVSADGTVHGVTPTDADAANSVKITSDGQDASIDISVTDNDQLQFTLSVKKTDNETGAKLTGAAFELDVADGTNWKKVSTAAYNSTTGLYVFPIVKTGDENTKYRVVETKAPDGYVCDFAKVFTAGEAAAFDTPYEIDAENPKNTVHLKKVDPDGKTVVEFKGFNVTKQGNASWTYAGSKFIKAVNGIVDLEKLAPGTYEFSEDWGSIPEGYLPDVDASGKMRVHTFTVKADGRIVGSDGVPAEEATFTLTDQKERPVEVKLKKTDKDGNLMENAAFAVYAWDRTKNAYSTDAIAQLAYKAADKLYESGPLTVNSTNLGKFRIVETASGKDFYPAGRTQDVVFGEKETEKTITMVDQPNKLPVKKTDKNGTVLKGVVFTLEDKAYYESGEKAVSDGQTVTPYQATATTGANGIALFSLIPEGTYVLYESKGIPGYAMDTTVHNVTVDEEFNVFLDGKKVVVADDGSVTLDGKAAGNAAATVVNTPNSLTVLKTDTNKKPITGVTFRLTRYDAPIYDVEKTDASQTPGKLVETRDEKTTGADGRVSWSGLADGWWYIEETKVPAGVTLCTEKRMVIVKDGLLTTEYGADQPTATLTYTVWDGQVKNGHLYLKKLDKDTKAVLKDAVFSVYEWNTVAQDPLIDRKDPVAVLKYNAAHDRYETWKSASGKDVWDTALPITDKNQGHFMVVETKAPAGHAAEQPFYEVNLYTQPNWTQTLTIENPKMGKLIIEKVDADTYTADSFDDQTKLDGAVFAFWKDGEDQSKAKTYTTGAGETGGKHDAEHHGRAIITGLEPGTTYHYKETQAPKGYALDPTVYTVKVTSYGWINGEKGDVTIKVDNHKFTPVSLMTGGTGRTALYAAGGALLAFLLVLLGIKKHKAKKAEKDSTEADVPSAESGKENEEQDKKD